MVHYIAIVSGVALVLVCVTVDDLHLTSSSSVLVLLDVMVMIMGQLISASWRCQSASMLCQNGTELGRTFLDLHEWKTPS